MASMDFLVEHPSLLTAALLAASSALFLLALNQDNRKVPGPRRLPLLGNLHQVVMSGSITTFMEKYRKIYGNLFSARLGGADVVVVSGFDVLRRILIDYSDVTSYRPSSSFPKQMIGRSEEIPGILMARSPHSEALRNFVLSQLKANGSGETKFEKGIRAEIRMYIENFISHHLDEPVDLHSSLKMASVNVMLTSLGIQRLEYNDAEIVNITSARTLAAEANNKAVMTKTLSFHKYLPHGVAVANVGETVRQLLAAGMDITSTFLSWCFLYMVTHQDIQTKVQQEIDTIIGQREVKHNDCVCLPYTDAVLTEVARIINLGPTLLSRCTEAELVVDGKVIPAETQLLFNMESVLYDETVFEEPKKFKPQRYLKGDVKYKKDRTVFFGLGKRACVGKDLAKIQYFMFFTTILQKYRLTCDKDTPPSLDRVEALVTRPKPFKVKVTER